MLPSLRSATGDVVGVLNASLAQRMLVAVRLCGLDTAGGAVNHAVGVWRT